MADALMPKPNQNTKGEPEKATQPRSKTKFIRLIMIVLRIDPKTVAWRFISSSRAVMAGSTILYAANKHTAKRSNPRTISMLIHLARKRARVLPSQKKRYPAFFIGIRISKSTTRCAR